MLDFEIRRLRRRDGACAPSAGDVAVEQVVVAVGPWIAGLWQRARRLPSTARRASARRLGPPRRADVDLNRYLQEGEIAVDPARFVTADGKPSPVLHVDSASEAARRRRAPRHGSKPLGHLRSSPTARASRAAPSRWTVGPEFRGGPVPDGHGGPTASPTSGARPFVALPRALRRLPRALSRRSRSGGAEAFTADNFPVFDYHAPRTCSWPRTPTTATR